MDKKSQWDKLIKMSLDPPTDRNDILAKRFGVPMKKMTYRDTCIDYVKKTMPCVGYRDYVVKELQKLEQIEQIYRQWAEIGDNADCWAFKEIGKVLDKE